VALRSVGGPNAGVTAIVPAVLLRVFEEHELSMLLSGAPAIDVADWRKHTEYSGYGYEDTQIQWFWSVVERMTPEDRAALLKFSTGSSVPPVGGFASLSGHDTPQRFRICAVPFSRTAPSLPSASTWYVCHTNCGL